MRKLNIDLKHLLLFSVIVFTLILTSCTNRSNEAVNEPANTMVYDLYVMSLCPFGFTAVAELSDLIRAFPQRKLNVWFIGRVEGDRLSSLRGEPEIYDETLWLGVNALHPGRYREFLALRGSPKESTEDIIKKMGLDFEKIRHWANNVGRLDLREHYIRGNNLGVNASPTLFVNDNRYHGRVSGGQLVRAKCAEADPVPQFCKEYPECSNDNDCYTKGKLGKCVNPGKMGKDRAVCEYWDDASFTLTVLVADSAMGNPERQVIDWCEKTMPGATINIVKLSSEDGNKLIKTYNPPSLPFFHFNKPVEAAYNFSSASERLEKNADGSYRLKKGLVRENYFLQRVEKPGLKIEVYADPLAPNIGSIINVILSNPDFAKRVGLRPLLSGGQRDQSQPIILNRLRSEEALRWITIARDFPGGYHPYLKRYAADPGSSYWFNWLNNANINIGREIFLRRIEANESIMAAYREDIAEISSGDPLMIMLNNRTRIIVQNERELERLLLKFTGSSLAALKTD